MLSNLQALTMQELSVGGSAGGFPASFTAMQQRLTELHVGPYRFYLRPEHTPILAQLPALVTLARQVYINCREILQFEIWLEDFWQGLRALRSLKQLNLLGIVARTVRYKHLAELTQLTRLGLGFAKHAPVYGETDMINSCCLLSLTGLKHLELSLYGESVPMRVPNQVPVVPVVLDLFQQHMPHVKVDTVQPSTDSDHAAF